MLKFTESFIVFQEVPNETTLAINISNCPNNCVNCHSEYLKNDIGNILNIEALNNIIAPYKNNITCICFMGGDRFPDEINTLAKYVKNSLNFKTAWYSGKDEISENITLNNFDYIKIGHFDLKLGPLSSTTTNQRFYMILNEEKHDITYMFTRSN